MAVTIAVLSQKGGTGKTTAVRTLTDVFRRLELRVLAVARAVDGQCAGCCRLRAALSRGAVLRAAGRRAGARSDRARPGEPQSRPRVGWGDPQHRRHAHPALPGGVRLAARALRREVV